VRLVATANAIVTRVARAARRQAYGRRRGRASGPPRGAVLVRDGGRHERCAGGRVAHVPALALTSAHVCVCALGNGMGAPGVTALARALASNRTVHTVWLWSTPHGTERARTAPRALERLIDCMPQRIERATRAPRPLRTRSAPTAHCASSIFAVRARVRASCAHARRPRDGRAEQTTGWVTRARCRWALPSR
jgi:hypothetical protein